MYQLVMITERRHRPLARRHAAWILCLGLCGCAELPPHMKQELVQADKSYRANDMPAAIKRLDPLLAQFPNTPESAEAYYLRALCRIKLSKATDALADLLECVRLSTRADLTARAYASMGGVQHDLGQYAAAAASFEKALQKLPDQSPTDQVRLRYGICLQRLGKWEEARTAFSTLIRRFPSSPYAEDARRRFSWKHSFFSIQCGAFVGPQQADALVQKLRSAISEGWVEPEARYGRPMYVVYAGKYGTLAEAEAGLRAARRVTPEAFIVP